MAHVYFHVDLNAFFVNAEILIDPQLKGKPVVVSGKTRRSVVSTASYEARKFGVHSAMPISEAMQLCKDLIVVEGHYNYYSELSRQFISILKEYTPIMEQASIDECYLDVTDEIRKYSKPLDLAWIIQSRILKEVGLPCSIGVAPNMFLAKMASDMKKPMGITVLRIREIQEKLWPLPISEMRGVGVKTVPLLKELNIHTIGDLATYKNVDELKYIFNNNTDEILEKANGHDSREIISEYDMKSMGVSETLLDDVTDYDEIRGLIRYLCKKLSLRLKNSKKMGKLITVRICYYDFRNVTRSMKLSEPIWKTDDLFVNSMVLFDRNYDEEDAIRLIGVSLSDFENELSSIQISLFDENQDQSVENILYDLNKQIGMKAFMKASSYKKES